MTGDPGDDFSRSLDCLIKLAIAGLAAKLDSIADLGTAERLAISDGVESALYQAVHRKACRVLLLELNAARVSGKLTAGDSAARWSEFIAMSGSLGYWESLGEHYPPMLPRLRVMLARRCEAAFLMARRVAADRRALAGLLGNPPGDLTEVLAGAGDTHRGGHSVAVIRFEAGQVVYKPRSLLADQVLGVFLDEVLGDASSPVRIRVPRVVPRGDYGWAEFVAHRYCDGDGELASFYEGVGHWLAVMHLLGGSDLHAENVIACGPVPVVVDCETLFAPVLPTPPSGFGLAVDRATALVGSTVLRTGMLPARGVALGWRGMDSSAVGSLPGQQPVTELPILVDGGTDRARMGYAPAPPPAPASHPSPAPELVSHWGRVLAGFSELTATLRTLDRDGRLEPMLRRFSGCPVRVVLRSTEVYEEIARMLWHPVSLHEPSAAAQRATGLLASMAAAIPGVPADPAVIEAEVADLLEGDVPFFGTVPRRGSLAGPGGTTWMPEQDLVSAALARWRDADLDLDRRVIQAALVSAYLNEGWTPTGRRMKSARPRVTGLDRRRRDLAAGLIRRLGDAAIRGEDGTVTWIAPALNLTGWAVEPLNTAAYSGMAGVAVLLAAYQRETAAGRADEVTGVPDLLRAVLRTMRVADDYLSRRQAQVEAPARPPAVGGYIGLGSQIWAWLTLHQWGAAPDGPDRARSLATLVPAAAAASEGRELLTGTAGAIVPLLLLAARIGEERWRTEAGAIGDRLISAARWKGETAYWSSPRWPDGLGGFAHGVTGIGWALARLAQATGHPGAAATARAAFAFDETLYDHDADCWLDMRDPSHPAVVSAWCHGAVGIGLSALDLAANGWPAPANLLDRAISATRRYGFSWNHTLCHGDLGCWELLSIAGGGPPDADQRLLTARIIGSLERNGPISGLARDAFTPALLPGLGGIAYQLLRMHDASDLPSALIQGGVGECTQLAGIAMLLSSP